jgi:cobalt/nickel transport system permease protein
MAVRRALARMAEALAQELTSTGEEKFRLARLDPRAKIVAVVVLIFGATFLHRLEPLAVLLALALVMIFASGIPGSRLMRVLLPAFLFSFALILPSILNLIAPGAAVLTLIHLPLGTHIGSWHLPDEIAISQSGIFGALRFLLRTMACVTLSFLLVASTGSVALLNGLRRLGLPRVFGMVLTMAERYLVVLLRAAEEIHLAKLSRTIEAGPLRQEQRWVAAGIGILFRRTHNLAAEVQDAMLARGYDGTLQVANTGRMRVADFAGIATSVALTAALIAFDRL